MLASPVDFRDAENAFLSLIFSRSHFLSLPNSFISCIPRLSLERYTLAILDYVTWKGTKRNLGDGGVGRPAKSLQTIHQTRSH